ncbi:epithelial cell-transforming sequence 2 oncogene-like isoform X2 [Electrophorus electricus]|uniref:epithelial cell-transforming sequence 2 oncogene-like isoform X2 n=1 Tax=Electrophorus electricus TaxID=8005 RepID=UPI0015D0B4F4|nr:epithelial cell-transforming sequence 2 oncogene-like isoform X2 [Electrophorus electricus]
MTSGESSTLKSKNCPSQYIATQLQFNANEYRPDESCSKTAATRFSAWTPVTNKASNQQLFQDRTTLILHWFDLWTDQQRKHFLHLVLRRCSKSQIKFISAYFMETVPVSRVDFTTVLPRFLSLYILSFLSPMDLCAAAQVSWYWRFLSEQDCLWSLKCVRRGWFLPHSPANNEFGAWKKHYIACAASLDFLSPREAAGIYGTMNEALTEPEEQEERRTEHMIRNTIRKKLAQHKGTALKTRTAWLTNSLSGGTYTSSIKQKSSMQPWSLTTALVQLGDKCRHDTLPSSNMHRAELNSTLNSTCQNTMASSSVERLPISFHSKLTVKCHTQSPVRVLLVSSRLPAYELVLCGTRACVVPLLFDYSGMTLEALLSLVQSAVQGRPIQSVGIMADGSTEEIYFIEGLSIGERSVLKPRVRAFWEEMCGWVVPASQAGSLDFFLPLAASAAGQELLSKFSTLSGLNVRAPTGICTGSYKHILSEWSGQGEYPPLLYLGEGPLLSWCRQAEWMEQILGTLRSQLASQLPLLSQETRGRMLGVFLWDHINLPVITIKSEVIQVLTEGLVEVIQEIPDNPLEFLGNILLKKCAEDCMKKSDLVPVNASYRFQSSIPEGLCDADWRSSICKELLRSEKAHVRLLQAVHTVYYTPLRAALDSNRAIISSANLVLLFSPLLDILETNKVFLQDLTERLEEWSPLQCVGDVFVRFCTKLPAYTNFFNNYPNALRTIDKCREMLPVFQAFLKRYNRTLTTRMLSLQELFLCPFSRVEEYVTLLQALMLYTPPEHPDHTHLSSALNTLLNYRGFINKLKGDFKQDLKLVEVQRSIQGCPNLQEGGRYLITTQDVTLLSCLNEDIAPSFRYYCQLQCTDKDV